MPNFARSSLYRKLTTMSLLSTGVALACVFVAFTVASVLNGRENEGRQLSSLAGVVAANSADALVFNDRSLARTLLASLEAKGEISRAALYDRKGKLFAAYSAPAHAGEEPAAVLDPGDESAPAASLEAGRVWSPRMRLVRGVAGAKAQVGVLVIEVDLLPMWRDILRSSGVLAGAMLASLLVSLVLARRFTRSIAAPVTKLIQTAQEVSASQNYTLRVPHERRDELGTLINSFNDMLAQIDGGGAALSLHRD